MTARLAFHAGTIELHGFPETEETPPLLRWDARSGCHRAPAIAYADVVRWLVRAKIAYEDAARAYPEIPGARAITELRPYQAEAIAAWEKARSRGVVVLPTGAGKTLVAIAAIDKKRRGALVVAPTLDLVRQWYDQLRTAFATEVGLVGGGEHDVRPITVTTYDSAHLHVEHLGARFGMLVFDEAHHLPGASYALAARLSIAPFRLGLTATPERIDGKDADLTELVGPIVYRRDITELSGDFLADYDTERVVVRLSEDERAAYDEARGIYRAFIVEQGIRMSSPSGWADFIMRSARSDDGRRAMAAYRRQKTIAFAAPGKLDVVERLLQLHRGERTILFTQDNATAYAVSRRFLVPVITHQTKVRERSEVLAKFAAGEYGAVATSKVLNEGVDVPDASVAIVISGSGSVREHVQRLGRVLRKKGDKRARLYELVTENTGETYTSERRRDHVAYR
jgi:superfamily II DNA or RNA helicase